MKTIHVSEANAVINPQGLEAKKLFESSNADFVHIRLKPGEVIAKHAAPMKVLFFVVEGSGIIEINDESKTVSADTLIECPVNAERGWINNSNDFLRIIAVKLF